MNIPEDVKRALSAAEHRAEHGVTRAIEEITDLLIQYPILKYDTHTGVDHPFALLAGIHAQDKEVIEIVKRRNK